MTSRPPRTDLESAVRRAALSEGFRLDPGQEAALRRLAELAPEHPGVYLYGPAGRGKTWLADAFFEASPLEPKRRTHLTSFMRQLNERIHARRSEGEKDAVAAAIGDLVSGLRLLLIDEIHVYDAGSATLLTAVLRRLADSDTALVATSNDVPENLLPDPVWHELFLPGIALIREEFETLEVDSGTDYRDAIGGEDDGGRGPSPSSRPGRGFRAGTWSVTARESRADVGAAAGLPGSERLVGGADRVESGSRSFPAERVVLGETREESELEMTFAQLCDELTATVDFERWADRFGHWTVTGVPAFEGPAQGGELSARMRFTAAVDLLVDMDVRLDVTSVVSRDEFVRGALESVSAAKVPAMRRFASRLKMLRAL
ncbi:AFG1/ZapE family ATPase [Arthrobacter sp. UM1]|uniref:AFG1/ZapE family ATPase n=1 Tax=Arthrobacter sp. UM1 TaxID=2766776 RepID=UPI001CF62AB3|nr:AFG1/ZapE family ATPase [Arthrobacter sp. UM1]MCB4208827.1 cell division protein ZapE [Arthrobacter sp. UM1]